jgi:hypothetical protein
VETALQTALDKLEIRETLSRWCRGLDRADAALMSSAYHADAVDDHGPFQYTGLTAAEDYIDRHVRGRKRHLHTTVGETISVQGDLAACESYFVAYLVSGDPDHPDDPSAELLRVFGGRYLDRFERRNGHWKIARRKMILEWITEAPSLPIDGSGRPPSGEYEGRRSPEDPSYAWLDLQSPLA